MNKGKNRIKIEKKEAPNSKQSIEISSDRDYNERVDGMEIEIESTRDEEEINFRDDGYLEKTKGKKNISIKMPV